MQPATAAPVPIVPAPIGEDAVAREKNAPEIVASASVNRFSADHVAAILREHAWLEASQKDGDHAGSRRMARARSSTFKPARSGPRIAHRASRAGFQLRCSREFTRSRKSILAGARGRTRSDSRTRQPHFRRRRCGFRSLQRNYWCDESGVALSRPRIYFTQSGSLSRAAPAKANSTA